MGGAGLRHSSAAPLLPGILLLLHFFPQPYLAETHSSEFGSDSFHYAIHWLTDRRAHVSAQVEIPATPERVWPVLTHYDHLADFIPYLDASRVLERKGSELLLYQESRIWFLMFPQRVRVTFRVKEIPPEKITFQAIEGDFVLHEGYWRLQSVPQGTRLSYETSIEPKFWVPRWVLSFLERQILKATFRAIRQRCLSS